MRDDIERQQKQLAQLDQDRQRVEEITGDLIGSKIYIGCIAQEQLRDPRDPATLHKANPDWRSEVYIRVTVPDPQLPAPMGATSLHEDIPALRVDPPTQPASANPNSIPAFLLPAELGVRSLRHRVVLDRAMEHIEEAKAIIQRTIVEYILEEVSVNAKVSGQGLAKNGPFDIRRASQATLIETRKAT